MDGRKIGTVHQVRNLGTGPPAPNEGNCNALWVAHIVRYGLLPPPPPLPKKKRMNRIFFFFTLRPCLVTSRIFLVLLSHRGAIFRKSFLWMYIGTASESTVSQWSQNSSASLSKLEFVFVNHINPFCDNGLPSWTPTAKWDKSSNMIISTSMTATMSAFLGLPASSHCTMLEGLLYAE